MKFDGPWEPFVRDIDPTTVNKTTKSNVFDLNIDFNYNK
jgi:hypothetical protein